MSELDNTPPQQEKPVEPDLSTLPPPNPTDRAENAIVGAGGMWGPKPVKEKERQAGWVDVLLGYLGMIFLPAIPLVFLGVAVVSQTTTTDPTQATEELNSALTSSAPLIFATLVFTWLGMLIGVFTAGRKTVGGWKTLVKWKFDWKKDFLIAVGFTVVFVILQFIVSIILSSLGVDTSKLGNTDMITQQVGFGLVLLALGASIGAPLAEELFFRGVLYNVAARSWGPSVGIIVSGLGFGIVHLQDSMAASIYIVSSTAILGIALAWLYSRTNRLGTTILCHAVFNATGVVLAIAFGA